MIPCERPPFGCRPSSPCLRPGTGLGRLPAHDERILNAAATSRHESKRKGGDEE